MDLININKKTDTKLSPHESARRSAAQEFPQRFIELEGSFPSSGELLTGLYPVLHQRSAYYPTLPIHQ
jgi:hypothetical protein